MRWVLFSNIQQNPIGESDERIVADGPLSSSLMERLDLNEVTFDSCCGVFLSAPIRDAFMQFNLPLIQTRQLGYAIIFAIVQIFILVAKHLHWSSAPIALSASGPLWYSALIILYLLMSVLVLYCMPVAARRYPHRKWLKNARVRDAILLVMFTGTGAAS